MSFTGATDAQGQFTPYPSIDAYHADHQMQRGIYGTNDQQRFWSWVPMMLTLHGLHITRTNQQLILRLAA